MQIDVHLPSLLQTSIGASTVAIDATTVADALVHLRLHPKLGPLIFDEAGELRRHVLVFINDTATRHLDSLEQPLAPGDQIAVVQAVSGG